MIFPKKLKKGDTIGLVCTGSPVKSADVETCVKTLKDMGYKVKAADNLCSDYGGYMAGSGLQRACQLNRMFEDGDINAVFCLRGGYGSSRIMKHIDYDAVRDNPKIFVGYSDVTDLHIAFNQECGLITFHGPMVCSNMIRDFDRESKESLFKTINAGGNIEFKNPNGCDVKVLKEGMGKGPLTGGNLSILSASIGTHYEIDTKGKILFIEETNEPIGKIEKWAWHLKDAGKFEDCTGVLLGQFTNVFNREMPDFDEIMCFSDILGEFDIPVLYNIQSGHGRPMMTLPLGALCVVNSSLKSINFQIASSQNYTEGL